MSADPRGLLRMGYESDTTVRTAAFSIVYYMYMRNGFAEHRVVKRYFLFFSHVVERNARGQSSRGFNENLKYV